MKTRRARLGWTFALLFLGTALCGALAQSAPPFTRPGPQTPVPKAPFPRAPQPPRLRRPFSLHPQGSGGITPNAATIAAITAGDTFMNTGTVNCDAGPSSAKLSVTVSPGDLTGTVSPDQVTTPQDATISVPTTNQTPSGVYTVELHIDASDADSLCSATVVPISFRLDPPVVLTVRPQQQTLGLGDSIQYTVDIQKKNFSGLVTLTPSGLPKGVDFQFDPNDTTAASSTLTLTARPDASLATDQEFQVLGSAKVEVSPGKARLTVEPSVSLTVTPSMATVNGAGTLDFVYQVRKLGYSGSVALDLQIMGPGGPQAFILTTDPTGFTDSLSIKVQAQVFSITAPGPYTIRATPFFPPGIENVKAIPVDAQLQVRQPPGVGVFVTPGRQQVAAGKTATFQVQYRKTGVSGAVKLLEVTNLPPGTTLNPAIGAVEPAQIKAKVPQNAMPLTYTLTFRFSYKLNGQAMTAASNSVDLVVGDAGTVSISTNTDVQTINAGGRPLTYLIDVMRSKGFKTAVQLTATDPPPPDCPAPPSEVMRVFDPPGGLVPANEDSPTLSLSAPATTPSGGPYCLRLMGKAPVSGVVSNAVDIQFMIVGATPIGTLVASLNASPAAQAVQAGQTAVYAVTVSGADAQHPVTLSATGLPLGARATFNPNPAAATSTLSVTTLTGTPIGSSILTLNGTLGGKALKPATVSLTVTAPPPTPVPTITGFSPTSGMIGSSVQITGTNLGRATNVLFNGVLGSASLGAISDTAINVTVLPVATSGPITVVTPTSSVTSAGSFTVLASPTPPAIDSFSPTSGQVGTSVTIQGRNLKVIQNVFFNGQVAVFQESTDGTRLTTQVPPGATSGPIRVVAAGGTATSLASFMVTTPQTAGPTITGLSPSSGIFGTQVTIFGANLSGAAVTFGGLPADQVVPFPGGLTAFVPDGAPIGSVQVVVTTPGGTASTFFRVTRPIL